MAKKRTKKPLKKPLNHWSSKFPITILLAGILLLSISFFIKIHVATRLSFEGKYISTSSSVNKIVPVRIDIPKIDVTLPVYETSIVKGEWQVAKNGASYLKDSSGINQKNSAIIYDHNTKGKFQELSKLKPNDTIVVEGSDKKIYVYKVIETKIVKPTDVAVLTQDSSENLILYTCFGFADLKRFIVKAVPST